jgi:mannose-1-phosphate guanylyltransferase
MNRDWFGNQPFLVAHADNLTDFKPLDLLVAHALRPNRCLMTMMAFKTDKPESCGILKTLDRVLIGFDEKPTAPSGPLANAAVYVFEPFLDIIGNWQANEIVTDIIPRLLGRIFVYEHCGYHRDIGSPESLALARQEFRRRTYLRIPHQTSSADYDPAIA